jgi:hypothetical protein
MAGWSNNLRQLTGGLHHFTPKGLAPARNKAPSNRCNLRLRFPERIRLIQREINTAKAIAGFNISWVNGTDEEKWKLSWT